MNDAPTPAPRRTLAWIHAHAEELADYAENADPSTMTDTSTPEMIARRAKFEAALAWTLQEHDETLRRLGD